MHAASLYWRESCVSSSKSICQWQSGITIFGEISRAPGEGGGAFQQLEGCLSFDEAIHLTVLAGCATSVAMQGHQRPVPCWRNTRVRSKVGQPDSAPAEAKPRLVLQIGTAVSAFSKSRSYFGIGKLYHGSRGFVSVITSSRYR